MTNGWEEDMLEFSGNTTARAVTRGKSFPGPRRSRNASRDPYGERGVEPDLQDLIEDPVTKALMARDGVSSTTLHDLISSARHHLKERRVTL